MTSSAGQAFVPLRANATTVVLPCGCRTVDARLAIESRTDVCPGETCVVCRGAHHVWPPRAAEARTARHDRHVTRLAAVLFDMDGTLVDSEKVWQVGLAELAAEYGGVLSEAARLRMVGTSMAESMAILHEDLAQPWRDPLESTLWLETRVMELFAAGLAWRPGARELLAELRAAGVPTALVTATRRPLVEVALRTLGRENFDAVVCG